jgi:sulfonate transport system ATP-binding protein
MAQPGKLEIRDVSKSYQIEGRDDLAVLSQVSLSVDPGEFVTIVGSSGCGKSTLLRLILGLDTQYEGDIRLNGTRIEGTSLSRGIVFQDHRLLPWLTLDENIALALENAGKTKEFKAKAVGELIALVGLEGFEHAYPYQLSGGMAQRAAIARGLVNQPEILLLDEPLGALDALTRIRLQEEIQRIWRVEGVTMILVTHDVDEAVFLSNRVVVMSDKPGSIIAEIAVDLPAPRDRASSSFVEIRRAVFQALEGAPTRVRQTANV